MRGNGIATGGVARERDPVWLGSETRCGTRGGGGTERLIDKLAVALCCALALTLAPFATVTVVGILLAIITSALYEVAPKRFRCIFPLALLVAALLYPPFVMFLPLCAYDCMRETHLWFRPLWVLALLPPLVAGSSVEVAATCTACIIACLLSWRTTSTLRQREEYRHRSDDIRESSLSIEAKNRDLQEAGDVQTRLAMLSERGRIAREIHDNVGHLLTRAIMQVEALQVVHANDPAVRDEFAGVGTTLHAAMDEVRSSVHDLRDDAFDMRSQIEEALNGSGIARTRLDYQVADMPADVGYCFLAIVREALSNTIRHSDATQVDVTVVEHPGLFQLSVRDNGSGDIVPRDVSHDKTGGDRSMRDARDGRNVPDARGNTPNARGNTADTRGNTPDARGMGLMSMEDRVRALGGTLRTERGNGFRVFASIPKTMKASQETLGNSETPGNSRKASGSSPEASGSSPEASPETPGTSPDRMSVRRGSTT